MIDCILIIIPFILLAFVLKVVIEFGASNKDKKSYYTKLVDQYKKEVLVQSQLNNSLKLMEEMEINTINKLIIISKELLQVNKLFLENSQDI